MTSTRSEFFGESVVVIRAEDGGVQAFHNVCRHRAARLLDGPKGTVASASPAPTTPGPTRLDGRLVAMPQSRQLHERRPARHGLATLEHEVFLGFIFVRFARGCPACVTWPRRIRTR